MIKKIHKCRYLFGSAVAAAILVAPGGVYADFFEGATSELLLRNMYMNRDHRQANAPQSKSEEWAQGATLWLRSGFTDGPVGFGLDAMGQLGLKLDSSRDRRGTGLLPFGADSQEPVDEFSELGLTAKVRVSSTQLHLGTLQPRLPVVAINDSRLLSSSYAGGLLTSRELDGLTFTAGRITDINLRDSSSNDDIGYARIASSHLDVGGVAYSFSPTLNGSYFYAQMDDIYQQHFLGLVSNYAFDNGMRLRTDLRYFRTTEHGSQALRSASRVHDGKVDNHFINGMVTLGVGSHSFGLGYQNLSGDGDFAYPGVSPYSMNLVTITAFTKAETDAWQVRYDYDFAELGVPGLSFMTRYVKGTNIEAVGVDNGTEWEQNNDLIYTLQSGRLKGLKIWLRNATFRSSNGLVSDLDDNRIILEYKFALR